MSWAVVQMQVMVTQCQHLLSQLGETVTLVLYVLGPCVFPCACISHEIIS